MPDVKSAPFLISKIPRILNETSNDSWTASRWGGPIYHSVRWYSAQNDEELLASTRFASDQWHSSMTWMRLKCQKATRLMIFSVFGCRPTLIKVVWNYERLLWPVSISKRWRKNFSTAHGCQNVCEGVKILSSACACDRYQWQKLRTYLPYSAWPETI